MQPEKLSGSEVLIRRRTFVPSLAGLIVILWTAGAPASPPAISQVYSVTPSGVTMPDSNPECSNMVRIGNSLYFIYRAGDLNPYIRKFDLSTGDFAAGNPIKLDVTPDYPGYHFEPTLLQSGSDLIALYTYKSGQESQWTLSFNTSTMVPRYKKIENVYDQETWSTSPYGGLPSFFTNTFYPNSTSLGPGAWFCDIMGVYDPNSGYTHLVGAGERFKEYEGQPQTQEPFGASRVYYRIAPDHTFVGPYYLVAAAFPEPDDWDPDPNNATCRYGQIFTKGDIVLGKESTGTRSLHLVWNIMNTFPTRTETGQCSESYRWLRYDLFYAKSIDGGSTWMNLSGNASVNLDAQAPLRYEDHLTWNDPSFRIFQGDVMHGSERSFDVDNQGRPILVFPKYLEGGNCVDIDVRDGQPMPCSACQGSGCHVDQGYDECENSSVRYGLVCRRWDDTANNWVETAIPGPNPDGSYPLKPCLNMVTRVRVDRADRIWVFVCRAAFGDQKNHYTVSSDNGATWAPWHELTSELYANAMYSYADPIDPNWHYLAWYQWATLRFVRLKLTGIFSTTPPESKTVWAGDSATFSVSADGDAPLHYQWRKNGQPISGATNASYTVSSANDSADYDVVVWNDYETVTSAAAHLTCIPRQWTQRTPATQPTARTEAAAAYAGSGTVLLFGGNTAGGPSGDTWSWNGTNWLHVSSSGPYQRYGHAMADHPGQGIWLVGGYDGCSTFNDTWLWSGATWTSCLTAPYESYYHSLTYDASWDEVMMFGGSIGGEPSAEWWGGGGCGWEGYDPWGPAPTSRAQHAACNVDGTTTLVFGGKSLDANQETIQGDTRTFSVDCGWSNVSPTPPLPSPSARYGAAMVGIGNGHAILFGGTDDSSLFNDLWEWDGANWIQHNLPTPLPAARKGHAMAYDASRNVIVLFGGETAGGLSNETWELDLD